ncbi:MAG: DNA topoisomerase (ATP-hydrolyzing) subunit B [Planctomycetes bacterium]|nr:DNA topoisomerase (ATP-hydrolyzing) subunit B [Planctomycetota bacterium]
MADSIMVLEGLEPVRKRPAMFIGDVSTRGLHHLIFEVVDNSIDEAMQGCATQISVRLNADGSCTVVDDGRGIPVDMHPEQHRPALEVIMTTLHSGGKFDKNSYKVSGGLHGVGVSVVNALSEWLEVEVYRDEHVYHQAYRRGNPMGDMSTRGRTTRRGTKVTFLPDREIFKETTSFVYDVMTKRMRELAFLNKGLLIQVADERDGREETFHYDRGLSAFIEHLNRARTPIHPDVVCFRQDLDGVAVEVAFQYTDDYKENIYSFANNINTQEGGTHVSGFKSGLTGTLNRHARTTGWLKDVKGTLQGEDFREGITAVISVLVAEPQFEAQTKGRLGNRDVQGIVEQVVNTQLGAYCETHPGSVRAIVQKALDAARVREAKKKAAELARRKGALSSGSLPGKLADCQSRVVEETEIYIVEGDSAGGSAKQGRDRRYQAILPLRGKILNVEKARIDKMLGHEEIQVIISALGTGIGTGEEGFHIERLRYGKVIIMTDADVDGSHIRTLLLTFFFRHMPALVEQGHVYIACPPLYRIKKGKKEVYVDSEKRLRSELLRLGSEGASLTLPGPSGRILAGPDLEELWRRYHEVEEQARVVERHGVRFEEYLRSGSGGRLPWARVEMDGGVRNFARAEDFAAFETEQQRIHGEELVVVQEGETPAEGVRPTYRVTCFHERDAVERSLASLSELGLGSRIVAGWTEEPFRIQDREGEVLAADLRKAVETLRGRAEKGVDIQRYKGLGEMNPEQLWSTTMDPTRRTLLLVTLQDEFKADAIFTTLMGNLVEPRREFIEKHALEVKNLDV